MKIFRYPQVFVSSTAPIGGALEAKQDTQITLETSGNASLASIVTNTTTSKGDGAVDANTVRVTISSDGPLMTSIGAQADAAATTDTGSFSTLAFIKRGLQNWTTLLARIPTSLGQKDMAGSLAVTVASDQSALPVSGTFFQGTQPVSAASLPLPSGASTSANQSTEQGLYGDLTETSPATDTASSGLNGRLQRIAQRLTSLLALFPSSIGQKAMVDSLSVTLASNQSSIPVSTTAIALTTSGSITTQNLTPTGTATAGSAVELALNDQGTVNVQVTGTYTGALSVQGTVNGSTWVTLSGLLNINNGVMFVSIVSATQGIFQIESSAFSVIRVTALAAVTGTASISLRASAASALVSLENPIPTGTNLIGSVNNAQINGVIPFMGNGLTGTGSLRVTIASNNTAIPIAQVSQTGTFQEILNLTNTVQTFTAPANTKWCKVYAEETNTANIRVKLGGAATVASGIQFQPGRSEDFIIGGDVSVICETAATNQRICVQFGV